MNRESIQKHETVCRARRGEVNPVAPVRGRITGKRPPGRDRVVVSVNAVPKEVMAKRQKRGDVMAKSDTAVREKKAVQVLWKQHVYACEKAPWEERVKGVGTSVSQMRREGSGSTSAHIVWWISRASQV